MLSEQILQNAVALEAEIVTAGGFTDIEGAASSKKRDIQCLKASHEEADTRLILHALDTCRQKYKRAIVMGRDTDVLVLLPHFQNQLTPERWFQAETAQKKKSVAVHEISLSTQHRESLPPFHTITGYDTVSQLSDHGKKTAWKFFKRMQSS